MKIFHLSDLHIGKNVNGFSMLDEQRHAFGQIIRYVQTECPAAILIAGDIYDRAVPGTEAVCVFDDFLTAMAAEKVTVMIVSGNHDSPERLGYANRLLADKQIHIEGVFNGAIRKVTLTDTHGDVYFWLLPFIKPSSVRGMLDEACPVKTYDDVLSAALEAADIDDSQRNVLVSHQFYTGHGFRPLRSESEMDPVGGLDAIDAKALKRFDYAALGHLHGAQTVGAPHIRYAGSPVKYSFSECRHKKSITLIEMGEKGNVSITALPITPIHDMREIRGEMDQLISSEAAESADKEDYLRVILTDEEEMIDPMGKLRSVYPNIMSIDFDNTRTSIDLSAISADAEEVERLSPYELFHAFFLETQGCVMSGEQAEIAREMMETEGGA